MSRASMIRGAVVPILLSLVPGWGHIWVRRPTRGLALFLLFFAVLDYAFISLVISDRDRLPLGGRVALAGAAAVVVFTFVDIVRITVWARSRKVREKRSALFRRVVLHYLRGENSQAEEALARMLRIDPYDGTALVWLGMVQEAAGRPQQAVKSWKKVLKVDAGGRFSQDVAREIERVREGASIR